MCFSPEASFIASGGLALIGASSVKKTKGKYKLIGLIPMLFAAQQFLEGVQWLSMRNGALSQFAAYGFIFFAFLVWPVYVPLSIFIIDKKRRHITRWFLVLGVGTAAFLLISLITHPLNAVMLDGSIDYQIDVIFDQFVLAGYFLSVCGTPIVSSKPGFKLLGITALVSAAAAGIIFHYAFVSVWCFFGAIISGLIYLYARSDRGKEIKLFDKAA
jgi:hypothetical protein